MSGPDHPNQNDFEEKCRQLHAQLVTQAEESILQRARLASYETALRASQVTVFTQDADLRYTSTSGPIFGRSADTIVGCTDEEVLPQESRLEIVALKRDALATGQPRRVEIAISDRPGPRWHDLHIEPLRNDQGEIIGLTCASVDITERKEGEAHLRLLMRELTHRSKNLLAVIQAMARQTARHAGSISGFLDQFSSRLQALAASHDLLVNESWHGASLHALVRSQLAAYIDGDERVMFDGPNVELKPEAAQNLGLALHELASNAAKYGALSVPEGRVNIRWDRGENDTEGAIEIDWRESSGPKVKSRRKHGFGSMVIERNLSRALDAQVTMAFAANGLHCHIVIPASQILAGR